MKPASDAQKIVNISRKAGGLRIIEISSGKRFLAVKNHETEHLMKTGLVLGEKEIDLLEGKFAGEAAMRLARNLLARRERTKWEIRDSLLREGINREQIVDRTIEKLKEHGYLDDRRFASDFISYRMKRRPSGPHFLKRKLLAVGVDSRIIEDEIDLFFKDTEEIDVAVDLVLGRFSAEIERDKLVRRVNSFLRRRGFTSEVINTICSRLARREMLTG